MASFTRIREKLQDIRMASPVLLGIVQLLLITMGILNFLGGLW